MSSTPQTPARSAAQIQEWIVVHMARLLKVEPREIDPHVPIAHFGLDSVQFVLLVTDLEQFLGVPFGKNPIQENSTIASLAEQLAVRGREA